VSKRFLLVAFALLAATAFATGCGGGDDETTDGGGALTKSEFIEEADAICEKGDAAIAEGADEYAEDNDVDVEKPTKAQQEGVIVDVVAPGIRGQGEEIDELEAPAGDEEEIEAMLDALETGADELESDPAQLLEGKNPLAQGSKLASEYGLKSCGG